MIQTARGFTMPTQTVASSQPAGVAEAIPDRPLNLGAVTQIGPMTRSFNVGIDRSWNIGNFLGVANEKSYSKFLGLDKNLSNVNFNPSAGVAGLKFKTGHNKLKAGLDLQAGYGLGSFSIQGSL